MFAIKSTVVWSGRRENEIESEWTSWMTSFLFWPENSENEISQWMRLVSEWECTFSDESTISISSVIGSNDMAGVHEIFNWAKWYGTSTESKTAKKSITIQRRILDLPPQSMDISHRLMRSFLTFHSNHWELPPIFSFDEWEDRKIMQSQWNDKMRPTPTPTTSEL